MRNWNTCDTCDEPHHMQSWIQSIKKRFYMYNCCFHTWNISKITSSYVNLSCFICLYEIFSFALRIREEWAAVILNVLAAMVNQPLSSTTALCHKKVLWISAVFEWHFHFNPHAHLPTRQPSQSQYDNREQFGSWHLVAAVNLHWPISAGSGDEWHS